MDTRQNVNKTCKHIDLIIHDRSNIKAKDNNRGQIQCDFCEYVGINSYDLNIHEHKNHKQNAIKCNLCDFTAKNEDILAKHHKVAMGHKKKILCKFFVKGVCRYGKFCRFEHKILNDHLNKFQNTRQPNSVKGDYKSDRYRNQQCKFFDKCQQFPNCGFMHYEICKYQENCKYQERCNYVHFSFLDKTSFQNRGF